jgi:death-on-curing protein
VILPTREQIIRINRRQIEVYGGLFLGEETCPTEPPYRARWLCWSMAFSGRTPAPRLREKAAYLMHRIVTGHVFQDGNKRTGLMTAYLVAEMNGKTFPRLEPEDADAFEFTLALAGQQKTGEETLERIRRRSRR